MDISLDFSTSLARRKLTLPVDFIDCSTCLAWIERLIAAVDEFVEVSIDFDTRRTTIEYPAVVLKPVPVLALA